MARSTGPIIALGAITVANESVFNNEPWSWKVPVAAGIAAGALALLEKASPQLAVGIAWIALGTVLITRVDPRVPSPVETVAKWYENYGK